MSRLAFHGFLRAGLDAATEQMATDSQFTALYSSGASRVQGPITKIGNTHVRRLLIEEAVPSQHHRACYRPGKAVRDRWDLATSAALARGDAGNQWLPTLAPFLILPNTPPCGNQPAHISPTARRQRRARHQPADDRQRRPPRNTSEMGARPCHLTSSLAISCRISSDAIVTLRGANVRGELRLL
ncbi:hypothetical protein ACQPXM_11515 [Kribbella sp. CA-253562]|uniref:hypothetical protein n=1 Tax=Kribbella sp. CA-253562 TaxID=3239942 RepID=UPI003D8B4F80